MGEFGWSRVNCDGMRPEREEYAKRLNGLRKDEVNQGGKMEAEVGIEPASTALQAAA